MPSGLPVVCPVGGPFPYGQRLLKGDRGHRPKPRPQVPRGEDQRSYPLGTEDQGLVIGLETDGAAGFLELVSGQREAGVRRYTLPDASAYTCVSKPLPACLGDPG